VSQIVTEYCFNFGRDFIRAALHDPIKLLSSFKKSLEIDPAYSTEPPEGLADNVVKLQELLGDFLENIYSHVHDMPTYPSTSLFSLIVIYREVKSMLIYIYKAIVKRFPVEAKSLLAAFFFTRFIIPPLLSPQNLGITRGDQFFVETIF